MRTIFVWFLAGLFCSCDTQSNAIVEECNRDYIFDDKMLNKSDSFFMFLSSSDVDQAKEFLQQKEKINFDALNEISLLDKLSLNREDFYSLYRYYEYIGNKDNNELISIIFKVFDPTKDSTLDCLNKIAEVEFDYLSFYSKQDSTNQIEKLNKIKKAVSRFPNSLRFKYLYAKLNFYFGRYEEAIPYLKHLIKEEYYEKPVIDMIIYYYTSENIVKDSASYYIDLFSRKFPGKCSIGEILYTPDNEEAYLLKCKKCLESEILSDSLTGQIGLVKFNLKKGNFKEVENLYNVYKDRNSKLSINQLKVWERGEYFDLRLRCLFLKKEYRGIYFFVVKYLGYNKKISIKTEHDFRQLIEQYYNEYFNDDHFMEFYEREFKFLGKDFTA